jgi:MFS family permease
MSSVLTTPTLPAAGKRQPLRASIGAFVGTTIEWYDFYIFATAASLVFGQVFFPKGDPFLATLAALGTFAAGFVARPFGAVIFGSLGDRIGRKYILVITLLIMGGSTIAIGLLPSYASVGAIAPVLLLAFRLMQGIAVGGEWGGAVLLAAEHGTAGKKTFFASFPQLGSPAGMILSILAFRAVAALPQDDLMSWGWRLPFLASALLMLVGLFIRHGVNETPEFERVRDKAARQKWSALAVIRRMPGLLLLAAGANTMGVAGVYFNVVFMLTYTTQYLHLPRAMILECVFYVTILQFCVQPIAAWVADKVGTGRFVLTTSLATIVTPFIMYRMVAQGSPHSILIGLSIVTLFGASFYAAIAGFSASLFPTEVRYSAVSIAYQGCAAIAGGLTPILGTVLAENFPGNWVPLAIAYAAAAALSAVCIATLMHKRRANCAISGFSAVAQE